MVRVSALCLLMLATSLAAQPQRPRVTADSYSDLTDEDGVTLPTIASRKPPATPVPAPNNYFTLVELNNRRMNIPPGTIVVVDILTNRVMRSAGGSARDHIMMPQIEPGKPPLMQQPLIDTSIADKLDAFRNRNNLSNLPLATRLTGTIQSNRNSPFPVYAIDKVEFLTPEGNPVWSTERTEAYVPFGSPNMSSPVPTSSSSQTREDRWNVDYARLIADPSALSGKTFTISLKISGIDQVSVSGKTDFTVDRLVIERDYRDKPIRGFYCFLDAPMAERFRNQIKKDPSLLNKPLVISMRGHRYDAIQKALVSSVTFAMVPNNGVTETWHQATPGRITDLTVRDNTPVSSVTIKTPPIDGSDASTATTASTATPAAAGGFSLMAAIIVAVVALAGIGAAVWYIRRNNARPRDEYDVEDEDEEDSRPRRRR